MKVSLFKREISAGAHRQCSVCKLHSTSQGWEWNIRLVVRNTKQTVAVNICPDCLGNVWKGA